MPITAITGTPGAGKTLRALQRALSEAGVKDQSSVEAIRAGIRNANRHVVVCGVEGLKPGIFDEMEDANSWQDYPDGTLFLIDEAWKWWGSHITAARTDQRVLDLAVHRHRGFDFIITCQQPSQLQPHVRGLIGEHLHVTRKFGTDTTVCYEWPSVQDSPNGQTAKGQGIETVWHHPRPLYDLYQSATQHTIKRKLPLKVLLIPAVGVAAAGLLAVGAYLITGIGGEAKAGAPAAGGEDAPAARSSAVPPVLSKAEYAERFLPRFPTMPQSAPAYDGREVAAEPEVYCMSSKAGKDASGEWSEGGAICLTDQGTVYELSEGEARRVARFGTPYNHYKAARRSENRPVATELNSAGNVGHADRLSSGSVMTAPQMGAYGDIGIELNPGRAPGKPL